MVLISLFCPLCYLNSIRTHPFPNPPQNIFHPRHRLHQNRQPIQTALKIPEIRDNGKDCPCLNPRRLRSINKHVNGCCHHKQLNQHSSSGFNIRGFDPQKTHEIKMLPQPQQGTLIDDPRLAFQIIVDAAVEAVNRFP